MLVSVVFVMRPVWKFRFARIRSEKIGHFISETDLALALLVPKAAQKIRSTNFFLMPEDACNEQLRKMYLALDRLYPLFAFLTAGFLA